MLLIYLDRQFGFVPFHSTLSSDRLIAHVVAVSVPVSRILSFDIIRMTRVGNPSARVDRFQVHVTGDPLCENTVYVDAFRREALFKRPPAPSAIVKFAELIVQVVNQGCFRRIVADDLFHQFARQIDFAMPVNLFAQPGE